MTTNEFAAGDLRATGLPRRTWARSGQVLAWTLLALLPLSVLIAIFVLNLMADSAAAATGGCGGG